MLRWWSISIKLWEDLHLHHGNLKVMMVLTLSQTTKIFPRLKAGLLWICLKHKKSIKAISNDMSRHDVQKVSIFFHLRNIFDLPKLLVDNEAFWTNFILGFWILHLRTYSVHQHRLVIFVYQGRGYFLILFAGIIQVCFRNHFCLVLSMDKSWITFLKGMSFLNKDGSHRSFSHIDRTRVQLLAHGRKIQLVDCKEMDRINEPIQNIYF